MTLIQRPERPHERVLRGFFRLLPVSEEEKCVALELGSVQGHQARVGGKIAGARPGDQVGIDLTHL